jgi:type I restriction enzyme S subunit
VSEDVTSPETWIRVRFEEILTFLRNGISKKPDAEEGLPILRISAVRPGAVDLSDVRFLSGSLEVYRDYVIEPGDLLFTRYNGNPDFVGVCGAVRKVNRPTLHPDKLIRAKVKRDMASARYLEIALNTGEARQFLARRVRTTAGQSGVSGGDIRQIPLSLPPLEDQERIACEVERRSLVIDSLQASLAVALVRADRLRQSVLKRAFEGKLVPQDSNDEAASILLDRIRAERVRAPSTNRRRSPRSRGAEAMAAE